MRWIKDEKRALLVIERLVVGNSQLCLCFVIAGIWSFIFQDYLLFRKAFVFDQFAIDTLSQFYPIEYFRLKNLLSGTFPFWSFQFDLGIDVYSLMANANPFDLVFLLFGQDYFLEAMPMVILLKFMAAGLFFHAFLRKLNIEPVAAIIGSLLFTFSGYMVINIHWYHYANYAVFVAIFLFCFELWFQDGRWFPLVIVLGAVALKGELQLFQMVCFGAIYVFYRCVNSMGYCSRVLLVYGWLALFFIIGLFISAYVLLPNIAAILSSSRVEGAVHDASAVDALLRIFSLETWPGLQVFLARFLASDLLGSWIGYRGMANYFEDSTLYVGILSFLMFPLSLAVKEKKHRLLWLFPCSVLVLCCFPFFRTALNGFASGTFKYLSLFCGFFVLYPAIVLLGQIFTGSLSSSSAGALRRLMRLLFIAFCLSLALYFAIEQWNPGVWAVDRLTLWRSFAFVFLYLLVFFFLPRKSLVWMKYSLLFLVAVEISLFSRGTVDSNPGTVTPFFAKRGEYYFNPSTLTTLYHLQQIDDSFYRLEKGYNDGHLNDSLVQGYFGTQAYFGFVSKGVVDFYRYLGLSKDSPRLASYRYGMEKRSALQSLLGVKYFLCRTEKECSDLEGFSLLDTISGIKVYRNNYVYSFGKVFYKQISASLFKEYSLGEKDAILLEAVVTETAIPHISRIETKARDVDFGPYNAGTVFNQRGLKLTSWSNEHFHGTARTLAPAILFFPVPFDPGWSVQVNGKKEQLLQLDFGFTGVLLPGKGIYDIKLHYTPPFFYQSMLISFVALVLALLMRLKYPLISVPGQTKK